MQLLHDGGVYLPTGIKNFAVAIFAPFRSLGKLYESACDVEQFPVTPEARITASR